MVAGAAQLNAAARDVLAGWVQQYERAWRTAGTDTLRALFTDDATYSMAPYAEPYRGIGAIAAMWEDERDGPDELFTMTSEIVACDGDTGVVRVEVRYGDPVHEQYRDIWIARFAPDGRCRHFEEWPFWPEKE